MSLLVEDYFQVCFLVSFSLFTAFRGIRLKSLKDTGKGVAGEEAVRVTVIPDTPIHTNIYGAHPTWEAPGKYNTRPLI